MQVLMLKLFPLNNYKKLVLTILIRVYNYLSIIRIIVYHRYINIKILRNSKTCCGIIPSSSIYPPSIRCINTGSWFVSISDRLRFKPKNVSIIYSVFCIKSLHGIPVSVIYFITSQSCRFPRPFVFDFKGRQ